MRSMLLVLQRGPEQETALRKLLDDQQDKSSPSYHQWLTPGQFGQQFGTADEDLQAVTAWLQSHGFQVARVAAGRTVIEFSGDAGQVREAFRTEIRKFVVNGEEHWANATDPQIPAALAPVVAGVNTLHSFRKKPLLRKMGLFSRDKATGRVTPKFGISNCSPTGVCNALSPADFRIIYNVPPAADGTGQIIAITGDSEICTASSPVFSECTGDDVATFRNLFGLSTSNLPKVIVVGPDPLFNSDETEADLDVQWAGAIAPNAKILFVIAQDTLSTAGIDLAAEYIVDNNLAPVLSESFGACAGALTNNEINFYNMIWQQAAAQGITVVVASGDSGSAGCDDPNSQGFAVNGLAINVIAGTPYNVAAGGTDFDVSLPNYQSTFWNSSNDPASGASAKGYVPETTWNDSCAQAGSATPCSQLAPTSTSPLVNIVAGGGGFGDAFHPPWQSGNGVPAGRGRILPDISLFAADGLISGSFYIVCESDLDPAGAPCSLTAPFPFVDFLGVGGTSASAPAFAAIMALVNQRMGCALPATPPACGQGNVGYVLYPMASHTGVFHDITKGNNSVPCLGNALGCTSINSGSSNLGVLDTPNSQNLPSGTQAYVAGPGYDLATGLGSLDVTNLLNAWPLATGFTPTTTAIVTLQPTNIVHGGLVNVTVTVSPAPPTPSISGVASEAVTLIGTCLSTNPGCFSGSNTFAVDVLESINTGGQNVDAWPLVNGTAAGTTRLLGGCTPAPAQASCTYDLTAHYPGDGTLGASDSAPMQVTVTPEGSDIFFNILDFNFFTGGTPQVTQATYGSLMLFRTLVTGGISQQQTASGNVTITDNSMPFGAGVYPLNTASSLLLQNPAVSFPGNLNPVFVTPALSVGAHGFALSYSGDGSYQPSNTGSGVFPLTITQAPTTATVFAPAAVQSGANFSVSILVDTPTSFGGSLGNPPSGTVTFFNGATQIGGPVSVTATQDSNGFAAAQATVTTSLNATGSITAKYSGDANYVASTSAAITVTVTTPDFNISATTTAVMPISPGNSATYTVTITPLNGFTGTVTPTCATSSPTLVTCGAFTPSTLTPPNDSAVVVVTATSSALLPGPPARWPSWPSQRMMRLWEILLALAVALGWLGTRLRGRARWRPLGYIAVAGVALLFGLQLAGCGGGAGGGGGGGGGRAARSYTITFTGTSGSTSHPINVTLTVQ